MILPGSREDVIDEMVCGGEKVYGDILDYSSLLKAMKGVEIVFHTAGSTLEWSCPEDPVRIRERFDCKMFRGFP